MKFLDLKYYCFYNRFLFEKDKNPTSRITNYPEGWMNEYLKKNFGLIDPALQTPIKENSPYNWDTTNSNNEVYKNAFEKGIVWGTSIPIMGEDQVHSVLSFVYKSEEQAEKFESPKNMREFYNFATLFHIIVTTSRRDYEFNPLTKKEIIVLSWLHKGKRYQDIADIEKISLSTVQSHINNIYKKLNVENKAAAVYMGLKYHII